MIPKIVKAKHIQGFTLHLQFSDGTEGDVNLENELEGEVFTPLRDLAYFDQFKVSPELHTVVWPNGADFAPEFLYDKIQIPA
jgi:hypothetical protein